MGLSVVCNVEIDVDLVPAVLPSVRCAAPSLPLFVPPSTFGLLEEHKQGWSTGGTGLLPASHNNTRLSSRQLSSTIRPHFSCARPGRDTRNQRLRYHVVMTLKCYLSMGLTPRVMSL